MVPAVARGIAHVNAHVQARKPSRRRPAHSQVSPGDFDSYPGAGGDHAGGVNRVAGGDMVLDDGAGIVGDAPLGGTAVKAGRLGVVHVEKYLDARPIPGAAGLAYSTPGSLTWTAIQRAVAFHTVLNCPQAVVS